MDNDFFLKEGQFVEVIKENPLAPLGTKGKIHKLHRNTAEVIVNGKIEFIALRVLGAISISKEEEQDTKDEQEDNGTDKTASQNSASIYDGKTPKEQLIIYTNHLAANMEIMKNSLLALAKMINQMPGE